MQFWSNPNQPDKFCVTEGNIAYMITHREDELKLIQRRLDANYAANIKARYKPESIEKYPVIYQLINLFSPWKKSKT